ncbi:MAG: two pore domain potassium channel family protein [Propionibacteriales bacterium]|nr:two pore domain potassium channel family protein [Propionibacteriales bacterium]
MRRWLDAARGHPSAVLLVAQLLGVVAYPFFGDRAAGRAGLSLFSLLFLVLAIMAVRSTPAFTWIAGVLGIPIVVLTILEAVYPANETIELWSSVGHALFYFYVAYGLIRYMFNDNIVTRDELYATGAAFTVVAWAFTYVFVVVQIIYPGSFTAAVDPEGQRSWFEMLFLSFTTLTSTGLSDVVPIRPHAGAIVMIEQVAGLMYVAMIVSRLVGLTLARARM